MAQCEVAQLNAPEGDMDNLFGGTVAIDGDVIVVRDSIGMEWLRPSADLPAGTASIFRHDGTEWRLETVLTPVTPDASLFASSLSIRGDMLAVGSEGEHGAAPQSGAAHIYRFDPASQQWNHHARLIASDGAYLDRFGLSTCTDGAVIPDGAAFDYFGFSVAIQGDVAVIGAPGNDHPGIGPGSAFVFRHSGGEWVRPATPIARTTGCRSSQTE